MGTHYIYYTNNKVNCIMCFTFEYCDEKLIVQIFKRSLGLEPRFEEVKLKFHTNPIIKALKLIDHFYVQFMCLRTDIINISSIYYYHILKECMKERN